MGLVEFLGRDFLQRARSLGMEDDPGLVLDHSTRLDSRYFILTDCKKDVILKSFLKSHQTHNLFRKAGAYFLNQRSQ